MDLWTEFEGHTIDSVFALNKLLQTEGRSAFFTTCNGKGESVLIRLIECHFDEDEILARWRGVQALNHPNFLRIDHYGQFLIEADDITAVYVVFERADANLGQVLERGRLSTTDAAQIALSMVSALETLHAHGFVHEHVEARNIFAIGESVKLRSDCVRETPEGERGIDARRRDVFDLAVVLLQVLTGRQDPLVLHQRSPLPAPFEDIVRNGMSGAWGLEAIGAALASHKATKTTAAASAKTLSAAASTPVSSAAQTASSASAARPSDGPAKAFTGTAADREPRVEPRVASRLDSNVGRHISGEPSLLDGLSHRRRTSFETPDWRERFEGPLPRWIAALGMLLVIVLCGWALTHHLFKARAANIAQAVPATQATPAQHTARKPSQTSSAAQRSHTSQPAATAAALHGGEQWRVVAFTYNHQDQAKKKASSLAQKLPGLQPEAFSPTGRGPWLVTVGGPLERNAAYSLAHRASSLGLPRDTYAQNYTVR